jgi:hypothetical protein
MGDDVAECNPRVRALQKAWEPKAKVVENLTQEAIDIVPTTKQIKTDAPAET